MRSSGKSHGPHAVPARSRTEPAGFGLRRARRAVRGRTVRRHADAAPVAHRSARHAGRGKSRIRRQYLATRLAPSWWSSSWQRRWFCSWVPACWARVCYRLLRVDVGLQADRLATVTVAAPAVKYSTNAQQAALQRRIVGDSRLCPAFDRLAISSTAPLAGGNTMWIRVVGRPYHGEHNETQYREVSAGYFTTLQARLRRGRYFREDEDASKPPVVIINETMAKQHFPGEDPLGKAAPLRPDHDPAADGDRRRDRRHQGRAPRRRDGADHVCGLRAGSDQRVFRLRADVAGGWRHPLDVDERDSPDRSGDLDVLWNDDDQAHQRFAIRLPPAIGRIAGRCVCRGGLAARRRSDSMVSSPIP